MKNRFFVLFLALVLGIEILNAEVYNGTCGAVGDGSNLTWTLNTEDSTLTIAGSGAMKEFVSTSKRPWHPYTSRIKSIIISDGVTSIGRVAFSSSVNLQSIVIPQSLDLISERAFNGCNNLTSVSISSNSIINGGYGTHYENIDGVNYLRSYSLRDVFGKQVKEYVIGQGVDSVGNYAFGQCDNLLSVTLPQSVMVIGDSAFYNCKKLYSADLLNGITYIGNAAFLGCAITSVIIPNSVTRIGDGTFKDCTSLTSVAIPNSVTSIGNEAFRKCGQLTSIELGNVQTIGDYAFRLCNAIRNIDIPASVTTFGEGVFLWCDSLKNINVAEGNQNFCSIDGVMFDKNRNTLIHYPGGKYDTIYTIPSSIDSIAAYAFYFEYRKLTDIICEAVIPPVLDSMAFSTYAYQVYVPAKSFDAYKTAIGWEKMNIQSLPCTILTNVNNSKYGFVEGAGTYKRDTVITLTAIPEKGYQFNEWSDGNMDNPRLVTVTQDSTFTAIFGNKMCSWIVESNDLEGAVITSFNNEYYQYGTQITVEASPNSGYKFVKWNDGKKYNPYKFSILEDKYLLAIFMEEEEEQDTTTVQPASTSATFTWPFIVGGVSYSLTIYLDEACTIPFCTIMFNQYGQVIGISFYNKAPRRTTRQEDGFTYTVSGLDANTEYYYKMETMDEDNKLINTDEGSFRTSNETTGIENQFNNVVEHRKVMINGQIYIIRGDKIYTITGQEVK